MLNELTAGTIVPATSCRVVLTLQPPLLSAAFALQEPSKPPLQALCLAGHAGLTPARCRVPGDRDKQQKSPDGSRALEKGCGTPAALMLALLFDIPSPPHDAMRLQSVIKSQG